jgi:hypothetical protein
MINLKDAEKFKLSKEGAYVAHAILTDIHYYLDHGIDETQIKAVLKNILNEIEK